LAELEYELRDDAVLYTLGGGLRIKVQRKSPARVRVMMQRDEVIVPPETGDLDTSGFRTRLVDLAHERLGEVAGLADDLGLIAVGFDEHLKEREVAAAEHDEETNVEQGHMARLLGFLLEQDFRVYLTSDHGNIEAKGCGRPSEGSVAEVRGERVRVYSDPLLRAETAERFLGAIEWPASGLPGDYLPLLAPNRTAFVREGERIVGHGGISIEELVVPFVRIREGT
jgi:hypothetical protein